MNLEGLSEETKKNLQNNGYEQLTEIQEKVIPIALTGKDVIGQSHTGTGKTAAFIIPSLEKLEGIHKPQLLILVPTRELALQVSEETKKLSRHTKLRTLAVYGGNPVWEQARLLRQGVDIIIGTPGRIIDHLEKKNFQTDNLKIFVLDEADEMIREGFSLEVAKIIKKLPDKRQTLLFSATISPQIEKFSQIHLKNPIRVTVKNESLQKSNIQQYYSEVSSSQKTQTLINFLNFEKPKLTIVFVNTKRKVEEIKDELVRENLSVSSIHSDLSQAQRTKIFNRFRTGESPLLITTDVSARGLDIAGISWVINYDLAQSHEFHIHRIGRTGRAGASGKAITFISFPKEKKQLMTTIKQTNGKIEQFIMPSYEQVSQILENELVKKISIYIELNDKRKQENNKEIHNLVEKHGANNVINSLFYLLIEPKKKFLKSYNSTSKIDNTSNSSYRFRKPRKFVKRKSFYSERKS